MAITEEAARGLEDQFLSALEVAQHAYEDIVAAKAWTALGFETFTEWWTAKVVPKMRALEMKPKKEVAQDAVQRIAADQQKLPKPQQMLHREIGEATGMSRRSVARSLQGANAPQRDLVRGRSPTSTVDWDQAVNMAREGMTFAEIGRALGVDESTIRRDIGVRQARAAVDPTFPVNEDVTVRHHEETVACEVEPFSDLLKGIRRDLNRAASGRFYSLSERDKKRLAKTVADEFNHDQKLVEFLLAAIQGENSGT